MNHHTLKLPTTLDLMDDNETILWRYFDLPGFLAFLTSQSLFFRRPAHFEDPWEGCFPRLLAPAVPDDHSTESSRLSAAFGGSIAEMAMRYGVLVNCWHESPHESEAMWKLYSKGSAGIAIRTTVQKVKLAMRSIQSPWGISRILYIKDYSDINSINEGDRDVPPFILKRVSFEHEREARLFLLLSSGEVSPADFLSGQTPGKSDIGANVRIDPHILLDDIVLSPYTEPWIADSLAAILTALGYNSGVVRRSQLMDACPWRTTVETIDSSGNVSLTSKVEFSNDKLLGEFVTLLKSSFEKQEGDAPPTLQP